MALRHHIGSRFGRVWQGVLVACCITWGCTEPYATDLTSFTCDGTNCLAGYECNPQTGECVPSIVVGCGADDPAAVCPDTIKTGDPCSSAASFLKCKSAAVACEAGCRTCSSELRWGACTMPGEGIGPNSQLNLSKSCSGGALHGGGGLYGISCVSPVSVGGARSENNGVIWQPGPIHLLP